MTSKLSSLILEEVFSGSANFIRLFPRVVLIGVLCAMLQGTANSDEVEPSVLIKETLQAEADGKLNDRKTALTEKIANPTSEARWHAGQVWINDRWTDIGVIDETSLTESIKSYLAERGHEPLDLDGHRRMANWCTKSKLDVQSETHWQAVLKLEPNDSTARKALNYRLIDGEWRSETEWIAANEEAKIQMKQLKKWMPQMKQWAEAIANPKSKTKLKALKELELLDDATAIFALEITASQLADDNAIPFVHAIRRFRTPAACESLVRVALIDPTSKLGGVAMEGIKKFPLEFYVPDLIGKLSDSDVEHVLFKRPNGETVLRQIRREHLKDFDKVSVLDNVLLRNREYAIDTDVRAFTFQRQKKVTTAVKAISRPVTQATQRTVGTAQLDLAHDQFARGESDRIRKHTVEREQEFKSKMNQHLYVLRCCTEQVTLTSDDDWWQWWDEYNERVRLGNAYTVQYSYSENRDYARDHVSYTPGRIDFRVIRSLSCLVASTPIQTDRGLRPIESIRQGDLVLSQDIQTGELAMKPVVDTTLRPPAMTKIIVTEQGNVQATMGHFWWIAGKGWVRTKELEPGMRIHHATGTTTIVRLDDGTDEPTYNLIVADNHSYFVGPERLLSYDATDLTPTLQIVPGLAASSLVAKANANP